MYRSPIHLANLRPSLMEVKGVVVWQRSTGDGTSLLDGNMTAIVRKSKGDDISAACGQLKAAVSKFAFFAVTLG